MKHLAGVGDMLHEWHEWTGRVYHIRRRLKPEEQAIVGDVVDLRCTVEGVTRLQGILPQLPWQARQLAMLEMAEQRGQRERG